MKKQDKISAKIKQVFSGFFRPGYIGQLNENIINKILKFYEEEKIGSNRISERLKSENKLNINQAIIGRILTKAKTNNLVRIIPKKELAISVEQKIHKNLESRKIHNEIRQVTDLDRKQNINIPKHVKYKIVFATPQGETTRIPRELQGVQYYKTKELAEIALSKKLSSNFYKIGDHNILQIVNTPFYKTGDEDREELKKKRYERYYKKLLNDKKRLDKKRYRDRKKDKKRWKNLSFKDWEIKKERDRNYRAKKREEKLKLYALENQ